MPHRPPQHRSPHAQTRDEQQRDYDRWRGTPASRGYTYDWTKLRNLIITARPLCEPCIARGHITAGTEVHHIKEVRDRPDLRLDATNTVVTCHACHMAEHGRRRRLTK